MHTTDKTAELKLKDLEDKGIFTAMIATNNQRLNPGVHIETTPRS